MVHRHNLEAEGLFINKKTDVVNPDFILWTLYEESRGFDNNVDFQTLKKKICYVITSLLLLVVMLGSTALILHSTGSENSDLDFLESEDFVTKPTILVEIDSFGPRIDQSDSPTDENIQSDVEIIDSQSNVLIEASGDNSDDEDIFDDLFATENSEVTTVKTTTSRTEPEIPTEPVLPVSNILDDIRGKWQQVRSINLKNYLAKEGGNFIYRMFAASVEPVLEMKEMSKK